MGTKILNLLEQEYGGSEDREEKRIDWGDVSVETQGERLISQNNNIYQTSDLFFFFSEISNVGNLIFGKNINTYFLIRKKIFDTFYDKAGGSSSNYFKFEISFQATQIVAFDTTPVYFNVVSFFDLIRELILNKMKLSKNFNLQSFAAIFDDSQPLIENINIFIKNSGGTKTITENDIINKKVLHYSWIKNPYVNQPILKITSNKSWGGQIDAFYVLAYFYYKLCTSEGLISPNPDYEKKLIDKISKSTELEINVVIFDYVTRGLKGDVVPFKKVDFGSFILYLWLAGISFGLLGSSMLFDIMSYIRKPSLGSAKKMASLFNTESFGQITEGIKRSFNKTEKLYNNISTKHYSRTKDLSSLLRQYESFLKSGDERSAQGVGNDIMKTYGRSLKDILNHISNSMIGKNLF